MTPPIHTDNLTDTHAYTQPDAHTKASPASTETASHDTPIRLRVINLLLVVIPFIGLLAAIVLLWGVAFDWVYLAILAGMYLATVLGITIGYHRLFTHSSFKAPKAVTFILGVLGSMAIQGPILNWVADHRRHHQHSDDEHDPHSPHAHGSGVWSTIRGAWHAHMGWLLHAHPADHARYVPDLEKDKLVRRVSKLFPLWAALGLLLPALLGGLLTMSWLGAGLGFLWGGLVRVFLVHHVTWSVNSICHIWGSKPYNSHDESRNNLIFGVLALGEGWHNNHHAFPTSARHGLHWWQLDVSYIIIWAMSKVGLAREVRVPSRARMDAKRAP